MKFERKIHDKNKIKNKRLAKGSRTQKLYIAQYNKKISNLLKRKFAYFCKLSKQNKIYAKQSNKTKNC